MKNLYLKFLFLLFLVVGIAGQSMAQYGFGHSLTLLTSNPNVNTEVEMRVAFSLPDACHYAELSPSFTSGVELNNFTIDIPVHTRYDNSTPGGCFAVVVDFNQDITLGLLFPGTYTVRLLEYEEGASPGIIVATTTVTVSGNAPSCPPGQPINYPWLAPIITYLTDICEADCEPIIATATVNGNTLIFVQSGCPFTVPTTITSRAYRCNGQLVSSCSAITNCVPLAYASLSNWTVIWDCNSSSVPNLTHSGTGQLSFANSILNASFGVVNNGTGASGPSTVCPYLSTTLSNTQDVFLGAPIFVPPLQPGQSYEINNELFDFCELDIEPDDSYYFGIAIDCEDSVAESDESYDDNTGLFVGYPINHPGCGSISLTPSTRTVGPQANSCHTYTLTSNVSWMAADNTNWATVSPASGIAGTFTLQVCATSANTTPNARTATITVTGNGPPAAATFIQNGFQLSASPTDLFFTAAGGSDVINITSGTNWTRSGPALPAWLTATPASGNGNGTMNLTCAPNPGSSPRSWNIMVTAGTQTVTIHINQEGFVAPMCETPINPQTLSAGHSYLGIAWDDSGNSLCFGDDPAPYNAYEIRHREAGSGTWRSTFNREHGAGSIFNGYCGCPVVAVVYPPEPGIEARQLKPCTAYEFQIRMVKVDDMDNVLNATVWSTVYSDSTRGCGNDYFNADCYSVPLGKPCAQIESMIFAGTTAPLSSTSIDSSACSFANSDKGYGYFGNALFQVHKGESYPLQYNAVASDVSNSNNEPIDFRIKIWMDFNRDGDYSDPGEVVLNQIHTTIPNESAPFFGNIAIPANAVPGRSSMRVTFVTSKDDNNILENPNTCDSYLFGHTRDMPLNIIDGSLQCPADVTEVVCLPWLYDIMESATCFMAVATGTYQGETIINVTTECGSGGLSSGCWLTYRCTGELMAESCGFPGPLLSPEHVEIIENTTNIIEIWNTNLPLPVCAPVLEVDPADINVSAAAGTTSFTITTNCADWHLNDIPQWMTVSVVQGNGAIEVTVHYQENTATQPQVATLIVSGCSLSQTIVITQAGAPNTLTANPTSINVGAAMDTTTFNVTSNCSWIITNVPSWMTVIPTQGSGNAAINVQYQENTDITPRMAFLVLSGCFLSQNVVITQAEAPIVLTASPTPLNIGAAGGTTGFSINTNCNEPWEIENVPTWLTVSPSQGTGSDDITITCQQNTALHPRSVTLTISGCSISQQVVVTQAGAPLVFTLSPTSLNVGAAGGTTGFNLTTNCDEEWEIENTPTWMTVSPTQNTGNAAIAVTCQQNTSIHPRSFTLTIIGCSVSQQVVVTQAGAPVVLTTSPASLNVGAAGGTPVFNITTNCDEEWDIGNIPSWITIFPTHGTGNAVITLTCELNTTTDPRSATLTIIGCSVTQQVIINQAAAPLVFTVSPTSLNLGAEADNTTFNITTNCDEEWNIGNIPAWLTVFPTQGTGNATISITHQQNNTPLVRNASLSMSGCNVNATLTISQAAAPIVYPWTSSQTSSNHSIFLPVNLDATIDGEPLEPGDLIGFFFEEGGTLHCSNFVVWQGVAAGCPIFGNDNDMGLPKNGFSAGEIIKVKVYRTSTSEEFTAEAHYAPVGSFVTHTNAYAHDGISMITQLTASSVSTLDIVLNAGWNMISSYVMPAQPNMNDVFEIYAPPVTFVKDGAGIFAVPGANFNDIGDWSLPEGYQVKSDAPVTITITGAKADPASTAIPIVPGWQIISYLRDHPGLADEQLASIESQIILVKNNAGQVYSPLQNINGIGELLPTQGYKVKAIAATTLFYPPNFRGNDPNSLQARNPVLNPVHFILDSINTGSNATMIFPAGSTPSLFHPDDEIGIFNTAGVLCGAGVVGTASFAITVWGDDPATANFQEGMVTDEPYTVRIWRAGEQEEFTLQVAYEEGDGLYHEDDIEIVENVDIVSSLSPQSIENSILQVWPNPTDGRFSMQMPQGIEWVRFYNVQGQLLQSLLRPQAGILEVSLDGMDSGTVLIQAYGKGKYHSAILNITR